MSERAFRFFGGVAGLAVVLAGGCSSETACGESCVDEIENSIAELVHLPVHCISVRTFAYGQDGPSTGITPGVSCEWAPE